jgi:DnaK suppressor protein
MKSRNTTYEKMLLEKKRSVLAGLGIKFDSIASAGRVAEEDQAQVSHDEFISTHLNALEYRQLRLVEEALDRIGSGDYGICCSCEEPIAVKRLKALPWARYCVECQERISDAQQDPRMQDAGHRAECNW